MTTIPDTLTINALAYAEREWAVIPLRPGTKSTYNGIGQYQSTTDPAIISIWWQQWPQSNIAAHCEKCGLILLDFDPANFADETRNLLADLQTNYPTLEQSTPTGGRHLFYQLPVGISIGNKSGNLPPGIDIKTNGLALLSPSTVVYRGEDAVKKGVPDGHTGQYEWEANRGPDDMDPAPLPDFVRELLQPKPQPQTQKTAHSPSQSGGPHAGRNPWYVKKAVESELATLRATTSGRNQQLNDSAFSLAGYLHEGVYSETELEDWLYSAAIDNGYVAKDGESEARNTIRSGITRGRSKPKQVPPPQAKGASGNPQDLVQHTAHSSSNGSGPHVNGNGPSAPSGTPPAPTNAASGQPVAQPLYFVRNHGIWYNRSVEQKDGSIDYRPVPVSSFCAWIKREIRDEGNSASYEIEGETSQGNKFSTVISAVDMTDERKLKGALKAATGPQETVFARMSIHLSPAISILTTNVERIRLYDRTGWAGDKFLIPGREGKGVEIALPDKLPYSTALGWDAQIGLEMLEALMEVVPPSKSTVLLAHVLVGPLAQPAGLENERAGLNVEGGTGRFKTSTIQVFMSIWGSGFGDDGALLKWGEGATGNALLKYAVHAAHLPFLIDNYKPNTGGGEKAFIGLLHNIVEGGERERLNRNAELRSSRPISCWPIVTGEDLPRSDAASLARMLLIEYTSAADCDTQRLTRLQANKMHLPAIGAMWLDWLEGAAGRQIAQKLGKRFTAIRDNWVSFLARRAPGAINPYRVASNLAVNELAFLVAMEHPLLGPILKPYARQHIVGLEEIALNMGRETSTAQEARRFLDGLQEVVGSGRAMLFDLNVGVPTNPTDKDRHIGWRETDNSIYLLPIMARTMVKRHTGEEFNSSTQLHRQLDELGLIQSKGADRLLKVIRVGTGTYRVLHLSKEALDA